MEQKPSAFNISEITIGRFWQKVAITANPNKCWEWRGWIDNNGYGRIRIEGKSRLAHRLSHHIANGIKESNLLVCHSCDNPKCVNPNHLWLGTYEDNAKDRKNKGRQNPPKGEQIHTAKLTRNQVAEIRQSYAPPTISYSVLAKKYGVSRGNIAHIIKNKSWK